MNILNSIQRVKKSTITPVISTPIASSMYFNGTTAFATLTNPNYSLDLYNFTIECWIQPMSNTTIGGILSYWISGGSDNNFRAVYQSNAFGYQVQLAQASQLTQTFAGFVWYHVAFQRSIASGMSIYVNGVLYATANNKPSGYNTSFVGQQITLGRNWSGNDQDYFKGYMTNIRITRKVIYFGNFTPSKNKYETSQNASTNTNAVIASEVVLLMKCETSATLLLDSVNNTTFTNSGVSFNTSKP
jgi:hypothetical protein